MPILDCNHRMLYISRLWRIQQAAQKERLQKGMLAMEQWTTTHGTKIVYQGSALGEAAKLFLELVESKT